MIDPAKKPVSSLPSVPHSAEALRNMYSVSADSEQVWADVAAKASVEGRAVPARPNVRRIKP